MNKLSDHLSEHLLKVIDNVEDAIYIKSTDGFYLYANNTAAAMIGRNIEQIIGYKDADLFPAEALKQITELDDKVLAIQQSVKTETHYLIKNKEIWFQTMLSPAYSAENQLFGIVGISRDITEQKVVSQKLQAYSEELDIILNNSSDAIYRKDLLGRYVFINNAGSKMLQLTPEQIIGHTDSELFGSKTTTKIRKTDRDVISNCKPQSLTTRYTDTKGEHWFNVAITPAYDTNRDIIGIVGISKNITELKKLELALREKNEQLITILESSDDAIFAKDITGKYIFVNKACEKFIGKTSHQLVDKTDQEIFGPEIAESLIALDKKVMETQQSISNDECFGKKGNEFWYHATISPAYSPNGELVGVIGISRNMTDYRRTQEQLWKSESRYHALYHDTPAIFITLDVDGAVVEANAFGAKKLGYTIDELKNTSIYNIIPPEDRSSFRKSLQLALDNPGTLYQTERRYISKEGKTIWGKDFLRVVFDQDGNPSIPVLSEDLTTAKELTEELNHLENHDALTGLYNHTGFNMYLDRAIQSAQHKNITHILFILELDNFKLVNDSCGTDAGDELLSTIANFLRNTCRERDIISRTHGDEFAVLMENSSLVELEDNIESILDEIRSHKFEFNGKLFHLSASIGIYEIDNKTDDISYAITRAKNALFSAKGLGKNRFYLYDQSDDGVKSRQSELDAISNINWALEHDRFKLYAQPILPLKTDSPLSYEILIRLPDEKFGLVNPGQFLPILEQNHLAHQLDDWVIHNTIKWLHQNKSILEHLNHLSINISRQSLSNQYLLDSICNYFIEYQIPFSKVCFEITETAAISELNQALSFINTLKNYGCLISLDDFGAGLSSFRYLRDLPVDFVKIDGAFIRNICNDSADFMLTQGIDQLVHQMGIKTIAEYVESEDILKLIKEIGIDYAQGNYIGMALDINTIIDPD